MHRSTIRPGRYYRARIAGKFTVVKVKYIRNVEKTPFLAFGSKYPQLTVYDIVDLATDKQHVFRSAARFLSEVNPDLIRQPRDQAKVNEMFRQVEQTRIHYYGEEEDPLRPDNFLPDLLSD